eukprot:13845048-Alexandrium_andersonii.AAC.1
MAHTGERTTLCESRTHILKRASALVQPRVLWLSARGTFKNPFTDTWTHRHPQPLENPMDPRPRGDGLSRVPQPKPARRRIAVLLRDPRG